MLSAAGLMCGACADVAPKSTPPILPAAFDRQPPQTAARWPQADWLGEFSSAPLNALLAEAAAQNLDIAAASARVRQADARARIAGAALLPQVDAVANVDRVSGRAQGVSGSETDWAALLSASYEIDFWGKNHAAAAAARAGADADRAALEVMRVTIATGVANAYFQVLSIRERIALAQLHVDAARTMLRVVVARRDAGSAAEAEVALQRAAVAAAEIIVPQLQQEETEARGALALLVGRVPEGFDVETRSLDSLTLPVIAAGIPSELLLRRPDIVAAEQNLRAANADLRAARAALFPSLSLTASGGIQDPGVQAIFLTLAGSGYSIAMGANLLQPIFDAGRRRGAVAAAAARQQELIAGYRAAILAALLDVETGLATLARLEAQRPAQEQSLAESTRAYRIAERRYREGAGEYLALLEAQRGWYAAREQYSGFRLARLQACLGLGKALGGGWQRKDRPADGAP
jgi:NodT family efflux transporter outer membrane factor (OMF) lipoprotein